ncbi:MAG: efflux RND transporter periplasmic adaptor subunit [Clostridiaceae bacterium]|nr:efflux RND transporter periplasmic adaptor subunit [Clostridiaceae bacterium]
MMKKIILKHKKKVIIGACIAVILIITGIISYNNIQEAQAKSLEAGTLAAVQDNRLNFWGEVKYDKVYDINIDFPSIVKEINVKEGDRVSLGQVLITLDMSEYLGTADKLQQQLEAGQAGLLDILQDTGPLEADIAQTQKDISTKTEELGNNTNADLKILHTSLELAKKEVENAKRDMKNNQALYEAGAISTNTLDLYKDILAQREKALTDVENNIKKTKDALKTELDWLNISLKSKRTQLEQIKKSNSANMAKQNSSVAVSQIDLEIMKNKVTKDYISSNQIVSCVENGIVQNIGVINGTPLGVQNAPVSVLQLIDADSIMVSAEVEEEFIKNIALDQTVEIIPVSDSSISISGTVVRISNVAVEKDGKRIVLVQIKPEDPGEVLKPGYSVDVYCHRR